MAELDDFAAYNRLADSLIERTTKPKFQRAFSDSFREISRMGHESACSTGYMYPCNGRYCLKLRL